MELSNAVTGLSRVSRRRTRRANGGARRILRASGVMTTESIVTERDIGQIKTLATVSRDVRRAVASQCQLIEVERRVEIVNHLDQTRDVYFLINGSVRANIHATSGRLITYQLLSAGDIFGELAALDGLPRSTSVVAEQRCRLARMSSASFLDLMAENNEFAFALALRLVDLTRWLAGKVFEYHAYDVKGRVYAELIRLAAESGIEEAGGALLVTKAPTDGDIASRVGTTRENVNRIVRALRTEEIAMRVPEGIRIFDMLRLEERLVDSENG
ncbi:MAG: Crp/Fnr family transcriptional regulator [Pseudomonadota bacterium]